MLLHVLSQDGKQEGAVIDHRRSQRGLQGVEYNSVDHAASVTYRIYRVRPALT